jgi:hypothetical protein
MKTITWRIEDKERCEEMEVEFIGGPFDGMRLFLPVVREEPGHIRGLEMAYDYKPNDSSAEKVA